MSISLQDKWLYIGTEKGNVYLMNMETFALSGYQLSWNKLMDPMQKNHPGAISHISTNPADSSKILIGFETGLLTLWDLQAKKGEARFLNPGLLFVHFTINFHTAKVLSKRIRNIYLR